MAGPTLEQLGIKSRDQGERQYNTTPAWAERLKKTKKKGKSFSVGRFAHGFGEDVSGAVLGLVPSTIETAVALNKDLLHSADMIVAAAHGRPVHSETYERVVKPSVQAQRQYWSHPLREIEQGHVLNPILLAASVANPALARFAAVKLALTPAERAAALRSGKLQGDLSRYDLKVKATESGPRDVVVRSLPRSGARAGRMVLTHKALLKLTKPETPIVGEHKRAARADAKRESRGYLELFSRPEVRKYVAQREKMDAAQLAAFRLRADLPLGKDLEAMKKVWSASGESGQALVRVLDENPQIEQLYAHPDAEMRKLRELHSQVSDTMERQLIERGAINQSQIEEGLYRHMMVARGASVLTRSQVYKRDRQYAAELTRLGKRKTGTVSKAKKANRKELRAAIVSASQATREAEKSARARARYESFSSQEQELRDRAHGLRDQVDKLARGELSTRDMADLGIELPPELASYHGMAGKLTEAEIGKELGGLQRSLDKLDKETARPNWEQPHVEKIASLQDKYDRLHPQSQAPWRLRVLTQLQEEKARLRFLRGQATARTRFETQIAKRQRDLDDLSGGGLVSTPFDDLRMEALGATADRLGAAFEAHEKALAARHGLEREESRRAGLEAARSGSKSEVDRLREERIKMIQGHREDLADLLATEYRIHQLRAENGGTNKPASGKMRLYRIEPQEPALPDGDLSTRGERLASGSFFTGSLQEANWYLQHVHPEGKLSYLDIDKKAAPDYEQPGLKGDERYYSRRQSREYHLPPALAEGAKPYQAGMRGKLSSPVSAAELRAEIEATPGAELPLFHPDQPGGQVPGIYAPSRPTMSAPRPRLTVHDAGGELFRSGQYDVTGDVLTQRYFEVAQQVFQSKMHETIVGRATRVGNGERLPDGHEWVRRYRGERIPHSFGSEGEHLASVEDAFDLPQIEMTSKSLDDDSIERDANGYRLAVPEQYAKHFRGEIKKARSALPTAISKYLTTWRHLVLHLRIPWLENNVFGSMIMAGIVFAGPHGLAQFAHMVGKAKGPKAMKRMLELPVTERVGWTEEEWAHYFPEQGRPGTFFGSNLPAHSSLANKRGLRTAAKVGRNTVGLLPKADIFVETRIRRWALGTELRRSPEVKQIYKAMPEGERDIDLAMRQALDENPALRDQVSREVNDALGDYLSLTPAERNSVRQIIPFYAWYREITRIALRLPLNYPGRTLALTQLAAVGQEVSPQDVPSYLRGGYPLGGPKDGMQGMLALRSANPYVSVLDTARSLAPFVSQPTRENLAQASGNLNPILASLVQVLQNPTDAQALTLAPILGVGQDLPQYRLARPRESTLYPERTRLDLLLAYLGDYRRRYDVDEAASRHEAGR